MMVPTLAQIHPVRIADSVLAVLREAIVQGAMPPGSRISVDDVAKQLGVSRTPVSDALKVLATDGLVEVRPRVGTFVARVTFDGLSEVLEVRRALELVACEGACHHVTDSDISVLKAVMRNTADVVKGPGAGAEAAQRHDALNLAFHQHIVRLARNKKLMEVYDGLRAHLQIARMHVEAPRWWERVPIETEEHGSVVAALEARDANAMKRALDDHLRRSSASLLADVLADSAHPRMEE